MGEEKDSASTIADEIEDLFDLVKEGSSYFLHIFLFFLSKFVPFEFTSKLFDNHKDKSSYDFKKDGKTFIYRLLNCMLQVEKHLIAMGLQYLYNTIPLPFMKKLYENFCINNNLKCTDVKLKKCKKALIGPKKPTSETNKLDDEESVAPVAKKIEPDPITSLQKTFQENQQNLQKNLDDIGKSIQGIFSAPQPAEPSPGKTLAAPEVLPSNILTLTSSSETKPEEPKAPTPAPEDPLKSFQHTMKQNQKQFQQGLEDIGKSIEGAFSPQPASAPEASPPEASPHP